jgi:hypothetical protein
MNRILLTSTALVMVAGIAAADGHASVSWTGSATAGVARNGSAAATAAVAVTASAAEIVEFKANGTMGTFLAPLVTVGTARVVTANTFAGAAMTTTERTQFNQGADEAYAAAVVAAKGVASEIAAAAAVRDTRKAEIADLGGIAAVAKADAGDFKAYSEVNATVTGTVTAGGMTLSAGMSVDAGTGYDFADDDTFDGAKTNGVGLDSVSLDMGSAGKITLDDNNIAHLVDGDDDAAGDVSYTNTFGGASFTAVLDLAKDDSDVKAAKAGAGRTALAADAAVATKTTAAIVRGNWIPGSAAVAADTQWSAKVSMPVGAGSVYVAMDEESGNAFGGSAMVSGATVSIDSKLEALEADIKANRSNTLGVSYVVGAVTAGATYNSIKDGDQWGVSASYTAGDMTVGFSTDEGSDWAVTGSYALGTGASIKGGVNYTEDAFLGLSFAF